MGWQRFLRRSFWDSERAKEIESYIEIETDENIARGMSRQSAREAAVRKFGNSTLIREEIYRFNSIRVLEAIARDARHALRNLRANPAWTLVIVLSLALGIGANSALFAFINDMLIQKLPVQRPDEMVSLRWTGTSGMMSGTYMFGYAASQPEAGPTQTGFSFSVYKQLRSEAASVAELVTFAPLWPLRIVANGRPETAATQVVSGNFYSTLGVLPFQGRLIMPSDDVESADPVAVISYRYWQSRFGMDPTIVGSSVTIGGAPFQVVGITGPGVGNMGRAGQKAPDISIPLAMEPRVVPQFLRRRDRPMAWLQIMGRLQPNATLPQLQARLGSVFQSAVEQTWSSYQSSLPQERRARTSGRQDNDLNLRVVPGNHGIYDVDPKDTRALPILAILFGMVLLIVCVNVANLSLSRTTARQREIAVRKAIGASAGQLIRQFLTESVVLAAIGGGVGLAVASWCLTLFPVRYGFEPAQMNWSVFGFSAAITLFTGVLSGLIPALRASRMDSAPAMRQGAAARSHSRSWFGRPLLAIEVAMSLVLLIGAGLLLQTLRNLRTMDVGFNPKGLVLMTIHFKDAGIETLYRAIPDEQVRDLLAAVPGIRSVAFSDGAMPNGMSLSNDVRIPGRDSDSPSKSANSFTVHHSFFNTMEIPLRLGRTFTPEDTKGSTPVAVVNEAFSKTFFPNVNPIGSRFNDMEIIGVVANTKVNALRGELPPTFYMPYAQRSSEGEKWFSARTAADIATLLPSIRNAVQQFNPALEVSSATTQMDAMDLNYLTQERMLATASSVFGGLSLVISMIGLFGLVSYTVSARTKEIGIRIAVGAGQGHILYSVMRDTLLLAGIGVVFGLGATLAVTRFLASLLFGLSPNDTTTILLAVSLMILVSALAGYLPARRASRIDPLSAIRHE